MDELTVLGEFRSDTPGPSVAETAAARDLLLAAIASEIAPPPLPLELQPRPALAPAARRGSGGPEWRRLVPLAAAVAVLAVVAGALAVSSGRLGHRTTPFLPTATPVQDSVPPYYVALNSVRPLPLRKPQAWPVRTTATVRDTSTGAVIARIVPPQPYTSFIGVSGAADDRTFVLAVQGPMIAPGQYQDAFFQLRIAPTAASEAHRSRLAFLTTLPGDSQMEGMALSPNGRSLAALAEPPNDPLGPNLWVYNVATGRSRTWVRDVCTRQRCQNEGLGSLDLGQPYDPGMVTLSWTQNGKSLAVVPSSSAPQLRLLNLSARGDEVIPNSTPFAIPPSPTINYSLNPSIIWSMAYMTPDAKTVFLTYNTETASPPGDSVWVSLLRFSAQTGKLTTVNKLTVVNQGHYLAYNTEAEIGPDDVLWTSYDGSKVIVADVRPGVPNAGIYSGSRYTPIRWPANIVGAAW